MMSFLSRDSEANVNSRQTGDGAIYESLCGWTLLLRPNSVTAG